jgi:hypothetical protein
MAWRWQPAGCDEGVPHPHRYAKIFNRHNLPNTRQRLTRTTQRHTKLTPQPSRIECVFYLCRWGNPTDFKELMHEQSSSSSGDAQRSVHSCG